MKILSFVWCRMARVLYSRREKQHRARQSLTNKADIEFSASDHNTLLVKPPCGFRRI